MRTETGCFVASTRFSNRSANGLTRSNSSHKFCYLMIGDFGADYTPIHPNSACAGTKECVRKTVISVLADTENDERLFVKL
jgi:hypothetical protein